MLSLANSSVLDVEKPSEQWEGEGGGWEQSPLPPHCYQMELEWRFRDLIKCFKNGKKCFNMQFAFILNGFGQKMNK